MNYLVRFLTLFCFTPIFAQQNGDQLFSPDIVHEIRINSDNPDFFNELIDTYFMGVLNDIQYLPAVVTIDGVVIDSVGVRMKGGLSFFDTKKPLKLDFNEYLSGQKYDGLKKVNLHNITTDPSMQREAISYEILRTAGLKTPRAAFTEVYINDDLQGLYTIIEQIDKTFLRDYFASNSGVLYKTKGEELVVISDGGTFDAYNKLTATVSAFSGNALKDTLDKILDTDGLLRNIALQNIINSVDNLIDVDYNYYIYQEPKSGLSYFIPWDFNLAFHPYVNYSIDASPANPIVLKMLTVPAYRERYYELACEALDYNFTEDRLFELLDSRLALIENAVQNDPIIDFTIQDFYDEQQAIKDWITIRANSLIQQLSDLNADCQPFSSPIDYQSVTINEIMASSDTLSGIADPSGDFSDWVELYNNSDDTISLFEFYLSDDKDFKKHWKFPKSTIIPPNDYLIIWADRDLDEEGLHADFKLNKDSGELYLIYKNFELVDSMVYETQEKNISYARVPNGLGDFVFQEPTFSENNDPLLNTNSIISTLEWAVSPNPSSDYFEVKLPKEYDQMEHSFSLIDIFGKTWITQKSPYFSSKKLANGFYFLKMNIEGAIFTKRVIIEK